MQSFEIVLPRPKRSEYVQIFPIADLHIGNKGFDREKAEAYRDYVLKTPDAYSVNLSDDIECAIPIDRQHASMMWDSNMEPDTQIMHSKEFRLPLARAGKELWALTSNHWGRIRDVTGLDLAKEQNVFLTQNAPRGKAPKWGGWQAMARIKLGKQEYLIHSWHGATGATTPEAALRVCRAKAMEHHADVYLMAHVHKKVVYEDVYYCWPEGALKPVERKRAYGVTGCFLKWDESYAERAGLPSAVRGCIKLELCASRWDVRISL